MKAFTTTTTINAAPDTIWRILTDGPAYQAWDPNMVSLQGTIAPDEQLTIHTKLSPNQAFTPKVVAFEPGRKMVWQSGMPLGLFQGVRTFTLEPQGQTQTTFSMREEFSGLLLPLIGRSIPDMNATFAAFGAALKERAERMEQEG